MITGGRVGKIPKKRGTKMFSPSKFNPPPQKKNSKKNYEPPLPPPPPHTHTHTAEVAFDVWLI